jgi:mitochondrial enoyl-[acyl-carrier protein] reductase / trans-2-enoyl-CoA reductase
MSALLIRSFGNPSSVLEFAEIAERALATGEVRIKILAAPINPADINWIEGTYGTRPMLPETPGTEGVGEIIETTDARFPIGQRVMLLDYAHSWQQQRIVETAQLFPVPTDVDPLQLSMLKVNPATAWLMIHSFTTLGGKNCLLQNAANSAVGQCVIQIARVLGIATICFVRNEALIADLMRLGADAVFTDDEAGVEAARQFISERGFVAQLALNAVGGDSALRLLNLLAPHGIHVTYGAMGRRPLTIPNKFLIFQDIQIRGFWLTHWLAHATREEIHSTYQSLIALMQTGSLTQPIDSVYPLSDYASALARLNDPARRGKVLFST